MELSEDMISEIFSWLPAKSLYKFKACSKSICELTKGTKFALKQSHNSMIKKDSSFFIQEPCNWALQKQNKIESHSLLGHGTSSGIPRNFLRFLTESESTIHASSNGLLLCETRQRQLFICNPVTRSCLDIPNSYNLEEDLIIPLLEFVFECNHDRGVDDFEEFKLIAYEYSLPTRFKVKTYMPKEGVWKAITGNIEAYVFPYPFIYKGSIHFILEPIRYFIWNKINFNIDRCIATHHLESGVSRYLHLPKEAFKRDPRYFIEMCIFKWGEAGSSYESMCLVTLVGKSTFTVWVLMDYKWSSWSKLLTVSLQEMGLNSASAIGFTVMNGDSLLFATKSSVFKYDLVGEGEKKVEYIGEHGFEGALKLDLISFSDTLRSCGNGERTLF